MLTFTANGGRLSVTPAGKNTDWNF